MAEILEWVAAFLSIWIYGTEDRPRHPFWRNSVRTIAFTGVLVSIASFLGWLDGLDVPLGLILIWAICALVVISAEYDLGSKKVCAAAFAAFAIWLAIMIATQF